jgi:hypothetical protein
MKQVVVLLLVLLWTAQAQATTRYVRKGGNNSHSCAAAVTDSDATAKLTIVAALACSVAGDTVLVHAGTYDEGWVDASRNALPRGTAAAHIALTGAPGEVVTITGTHSNDAMWNFGRQQSEYYDFTNLVFNCINAVFCFSTYGASYFTFTNVEFKDPADSCILTSAGPAGNYKADSFITVTNSSCHDTVHTSGPAFHNCMAYLGGSTQTICGSHGFYYHTGHNTFDRVHVYNTGKFGITIYTSGQVRAVQTVVKNSVLHNWGTCGTKCPGSSGGAGVGLDYSDGGAVLNTTFYNGAQNQAIALTLGSSTNNRIYNNTIYNVSPGSINNAAPTTGTVIKNNLLQGTPAPINTGTGTLCAANLFTGGGGTMPSVCTQTVTGAAQLANPSAGDFHLTAGSSAIDAGVTLSETAQDAEGVARPQGAAYDLGAFEFGGVAPTPPTGLPPAAPTAPVLSSAQTGGFPS